MCRIILTVAREIFLQTVMPVFFSVTDLIAQVVVIAALAVNDLAENALFYHV